MAQSCARRRPPPSGSGTDHALRVTTEPRRDRQPRPSEDRDLPPSSSPRRGSGSSPDGPSPAWIDTECMARRAPSPLPRRWSRGPSVAAAALLAAIGGSAPLRVALLVLGHGVPDGPPAGGVPGAACPGPWLGGALRGPPHAAADG